MIGNAKGYPLRTPLSDQIPLEKRTVMRFLGTEVIELDDSLMTTDAGVSWDSVVNYAIEANLWGIPM